MRTVLVIETNGTVCLVRAFELTIDNAKEIAFHNGEQTEVIQLTKIAFQRTAQTDNELLLCGNAGEVEYYCGDDVNGAFAQFSRYNNTCEDMLPVDLLKEKLYACNDFVKGVSVDIVWEE